MNILNIGIYDGPLLEILIDGQRQLDEFVSEAAEKRRLFQMRLEMQREIANFRCPCGCGLDDFCFSERERIETGQLEDLPF